MMPLSLQVLELGCGLTKVVILYCKKRFVVTDLKRGRSAVEKPASMRVSTGYSFDTLFSKIKHIFLEYRSAVNAGARTCSVHLCYLQLGYFGRLLHIQTHERII